MIICDDQPGEIYFVGLHPEFWGKAGLYYSTDYGEHIELHDSVGNGNLQYGTILADNADNSLYRLCTDWDPVPGQYFSNNGGFDWNLMDTTDFTPTIASGVIPGEIYRKIDNTDLLERSINNGLDYASCTCAGLPDTVDICSIALGIDSGEVYIWGYHGNVYYSDDYAENFSFRGFFYEAWHSPEDAQNGTAPGEFFIHFIFWQRIWRIYNYGRNIELIADFDLGFSWTCTMSPGKVPGELYYLALEPEMIPGGIMRIYHTMNYGEDWDMVEHLISNYSIHPSPQLIPCDISLSLYPNPANPSFNIAYTMERAEPVEISIYNAMGSLVWNYRTGIQQPGDYLLPYNGLSLSSGIYFIKLEAGGLKQTQKIILLK